MAAKLDFLPKITQYKHTTMTTIFHFVFQFQFQNAIAAEYPVANGNFEKLGSGKLMHCTIFSVIRALKLKITTST